MWIGSAGIGHDMGVLDEHATVLRECNYWSMLESMPVAG